MMIKASAGSLAIKRAGQSRVLCRSISLYPRVVQRQEAIRSQVAVKVFKFGKNGFGAEDAGIVGSQGRDEYSMDDVEAYFNYMGCLADEGNYDRMYKLSEGRHPIDVILLLAATENDTPKINEILKAGADLTVTDYNGKLAIDLASKEDAKALLRLKV